MDLHNYSPPTFPPPWRRWVIAVVIGFSITLRIIDTVLGVIHVTSLDTYRRTHKEKLKKNKDLDEFIGSLFLIHAILLFKNILAGNTFDLTFLRKRNRLLNIVVNFAVAIVLAVEQNEDSYKLAASLPNSPDRLGDRTQNIMIYIAIFHTALPMALFAWICFIRYPNAIPSDFSTHLEVDGPLEDPQPTILPIVHAPRDTPLPDVTIHERESDDCCICLEPIPKNSQIRALSCKHVYHLECLDRWLLEDKNNKCPLCSNAV